MTAAWHEDDQFWTDCYPALYHRERWEAAVAEVESVMRLLGIVAGDHVLDVCCGPGRHSLELAAHGCRVTGVDRTGPYLDIARERAEDLGLGVEFVQADMRQFRRHAQFDYAISVYTSFGYFEDPEADRIVLRNILDSLKPGGRLLMEMSGKEVIARVFQPKSWSEPEPGLYFLEERRPVDNWERIENRWVLIRDGEVVEKRFHVRLYSGIELQAVMLSAGFRQVVLYGTLDGKPYDESARRLVAVGTK